MELQMATTGTTQKWSMVLARDAKADGRFVYAVKSTGVFCRPSCPSRRPRRENVEFFDSPGKAQQAGYRACRRCTPLERNPQKQKVEAACRFIDENMDITLSLTAISRHVEISPFHFQRMFKRILGISPREYQQARRAGKFRQALLSKASVTEAIYEAGYSSSSRAYESVPAQLGMTPSEFRSGGEGMSIRFTVFRLNWASCSLLPQRAVFAPCALETTKQHCYESLKVTLRQRKSIAMTTGWDSWQNR